MSKSIIISSGEVNRYGYRIVPEGIDFSHYRNNPILLKQHDNDTLSIGKLNNIRIENGKLVGDPEFDLDDPIAAEVARKYEKGYMNACSIHHEPTEFSDDPALALPGQTLATVTKTELLEVSMCNVPIDKYATRLSANGKNLNDVLPSLKLSNSNNINKNSEMDLKNILKQLGLSDTASETEVTKAIETLQLSAKAATEAKIESLMKLGMQKGVINDDNKDSFKILAMSKYDETEKIITAASDKKSDEKPNGNESIADMLKKLAAGGGGKETPGDNKLSFDYLSKHNQKELKRIKDEEPEKYKKLALEHAEFVKNK